MSSVQFRVLVGTVATLVAMVPIASCGGRLGSETIDGTLSDAGVFRLPDGAVLFSPGSACATYNHAAEPAPECDAVSWGTGYENAVPVPDNATCNAWDPNLGLPYPTRRYCAWCDSPLCAKPGKEVCDAVFDARAAAGAALRCTPGPGGDAYCTSFFQQFVLGAGKALATCSVFWMPSVEGCSTEDEPKGAPSCPQTDLVAACVPSCGDYPIRPSKWNPPGFKGFATVPTICVERDPQVGPQAETFCAAPPP